jgi:HK97 family phage prohead protease
VKHFERRMAVSAVEFRDSGDAPTLTGYASTFNQPYDMGWYREQVAPGAFTRSLGRSPDVRLLINHGGLPLARTTSGTLHLDEDERGLRVSAELDPSDPDVASLVPKMKRGDLNQMSFGFRVMGEDGEEWSKDLSVRTLRTLDIHDGDVSVVTYPANPGTTVGVRSEGKALDAVSSALRTLEARDASTEDVVSVLTRALGYFTAVDLIVDAAQDQIAEALGIPNPDEDEPDAGESDESARAAELARETRQRLLRLLG